MEPQETVSPAVWEKLPPEEKQKRLQVGRAYAFDELFIYDKDDRLESYTVHSKKKKQIETNYYMIDFKNIYKMACKRIVGPENAPLDSKILQLSVDTRADLRAKIGHYYARIPDEDKIAL